MGGDFEVSIYCLVVRYFHERRFRWQIRLRGLRK